MDDFADLKMTFKREDADRAYWIRIECVSHVDRILSPSAESEILSVRIKLRWNALPSSLYIHPSVQDAGKEYVRIGYEILSISALPCTYDKIDCWFERKSIYHIQTDFLFPPRFVSQFYRNLAGGDVVKGRILWYTSNNIFVNRKCATFAIRAIKFIKISDGRYRLFSPSIK